MKKTIEKVAVSSERAVLVCTEYRGVFFGYTDKTNGDVIHLRAGRNCVYWPKEQKGFLGLASDGPMDNCRIGPSAQIELRKITAVAEVTPKAVVRWEKAPWA